MIAQRRSRADVIDRLQSLYGIAESTAAKDYADALRRLSDAYDSDLPRRKMQAVEKLLEIIDDAHQAAAFGPAVAGIRELAKIEGYAPAAEQHITHDLSHLTDEELESVEKMLTKSDA